MSQETFRVCVYQGETLIDCPKHSGTRLVLVRLAAFEFVEIKRGQSFDAVLYVGTEYFDR
jgi:hypothetical protein